MAMLVAVVEEQSFQKAAERLNVSATVVSKNIKTLEETLGAPLIERASRHIKLTKKGRALIGPTTAMLDQARLAMDAVQRDAGLPSGKLIVSVPSMLSGGVLADIVEDFLVKYPRVQMELRFENTQRHPIHDGVDLIISASMIDDAALLFRELEGSGGGFFAAPDLAERIDGLPLRDVLRKIPLLMSYNFGAREWLAAFSSVAEILDQDVQFRMKCDDVAILYRMCLSGAGLCVLPHSMVREDVQRGRLVEVLDAVTLEHRQFFAIWDGTSLNANTAEKFADHVLEYLQRSKNAVQAY